MTPGTRPGVGARLRAALTTDPGQVVWVLAATALLVAVFAPLTMRLYEGER